MVEEGEPRYPSSSLGRLVQSGKMQIDAVYQLMKLQHMALKLNLAPTQPPRRGHNCPPCAAGH